MASKFSSRLSLLSTTGYSFMLLVLELVTLLGSMKRSVSLITISQLAERKSWSCHSELFWKVKPLSELLKVLRSATKSLGGALFESDRLLCSPWQLSIYFKGRKWQFGQGIYIKKKKVNKVEVQLLVAVWSISTTAVVAGITLITTVSLYSAYLAKSVKAI